MKTNEAETSPTSPASPTRTPGMTRHLTAVTEQRDQGRDHTHARLGVTCKVCREERVFHAFIAPDPEQRAQQRCEQEATRWLQFHPCTVVYAMSARRVGRAAA